MRYCKIVLPIFITSLLCACTSSNYRDLNISDTSRKFNNIELSKNINERFRIQFESSIAKTQGQSTSYGANSQRTPTAIIVNGNINGYAISPLDNAISVGDNEYAASRVSYNYSVAHKTISGGFDFIHKQHFGLMLSLGLSQYDYSAKATMNGDVDAYKFVHSDVPVIVTYSNGMSERASPQFNYKISQGKVTNKAFDFDFTDYGCYVAIEPHYQFNKHYGVSLRLATSVGKDTSIGTNVNSELSLRLNYKPINPLEIYVGYQYFSLGKDLDEDSSTPSSSGHGESNLTIDTRGFLTGVALRF